MAKKEFSFTCIDCKKIETLVLEEADVQRWKDGAHIQNVFPQLTESQREIMISSMCGDCFDKLLIDEEDGEGVEP